MSKPPLKVVSNTSDLYGWEVDWVSWLLSDFEVEHVLESELANPYEQAIVVISGDTRGKGDAISAYLRSFDRFGYRPVVIHISDEWFTYPVNYYPDAGVVFRHHWRPGLNGGPGCRYLPLGYASGIGGVEPKPIGERKNLWCFAGEVKQHRRRMLDAARKLGPGAEHLTTKWADENSLSRPAYAAMLADTIFVPCPRGNSTADTFRFYEALELGAIPIVEDIGGPRAWAELLDPRSLALIQPWKEGRWKSSARKVLKPSYLATVFAGELPFPVLAHWETLPRVVAGLDRAETARRVGAWWSGVKATARQEVREAVLETLGGRAG